MPDSVRLLGCRYVALVSTATVDRPGIARGGEGGGTDHSWLPAHDLVQLCLETNFGQALYRHIILWSLLAQLVYVGQSRRLEMLSMPWILKKWLHLIRLCHDPVHGFENDDLSTCRT